MGNSTTTTSTAAPTPQENGGRTAPSRGSAHLKQQPPLPPGSGLEDDARFSILANSVPGGKVTRELVLENLQVRLSPALAKRLFDALLTSTNSPDIVDSILFSKVVHALERATRGERRRLVFFMFDPTGQGRVRKAEFRKAMIDMLRGFDVQSTSHVVNPDSAETKVLLQTLTDSAFALYCSDAKKGMTFDEWFNFATDDPETCRLMGALDKRSRTRIIDLRHLDKS